MFEIFSRSERFFFYLTDKSFSAYSSFHIASLCGCETVVKLLLEKGMDLNARTPYNETPLILAILKGHNGVIKLLLDKSPDLEVRSSLHGTALRLAALNANKRVIRLLLEKGANPDMKHCSGPEACDILAVMFENNPAIRPLLEIVKEVDLFGYDNKTALCIAAKIDCAPLVKLLLELGAEVNAGGEKSETALRIAVRRTFQSVDELPSEVSQYQFEETVLHSTTDLQHESVIRLLLENGAHPNVQNGHGETALHLTLIEDTFSSIQNQFEKLALHVENSKERESVLKVLFEYDAHPNVQDKWGLTALHMAISYERCKSTIRLLLENGAHPNIQDVDENTALHLAVGMRSDECVIRLLLENGARSDIHNNCNQTALDWTMEKKKRVFGSPASYT